MRIDRARLARWSVVPEPRRHGPSGDAPHQVLAELLATPAGTTRRRTHHLVLDLSASMATGEPRKGDEAAQLVATLAAGALVRGDLVQVSVGGGRGPQRLRGVALPRWDALPGLLATLEALEPEGSTDDLAAAIDRRSDRLVVVTDLLFEVAARERLLTRLAAATPEPIVVHVLAAADVTPDLRHVAEVIDVETGERVRLRAEVQTARRFAAAVETWRTEIRLQCRRSGIRYVPWTTPPEGARA